MSKILRVDMNSLTIKTEQAKKEYELLGGRAFIAKFLIDEVKPTCEPLGQHNKLIFSPGLLGGSKIPCSGRISIGGKSPLTEGIKESNGGGMVGLKIGRLGYKAIILEGIPLSGQKYLLKVAPGGAELISANDYWGLGVYQTADKIRKQYGEHVAISCIGPTGERKFTAAGIANTDLNGVPSRYSGRGGLGAVMGSKGIKAIIIDDSNHHEKEPACPEEFKKAMLQFGRAFNESPVTKHLKEYGTSGMLQVTNSLGGLPTRNFSTGRFEGADKISGEALREILITRNGKTSHSCMPGCLIHCSNVYVDQDGKEIVSPIEYETIAMMGSNLGIDDLDTIAQLNYLCNDYGLDTIESGAAIGVAMAGGLISFGDKEGAQKLLHEIGNGTLTGRVLGMGAKITGKVLGVMNLPVVKGQSMGAYEPRAIQGTGVTYATSPMGADHTAGLTVMTKIDHHSPEGQAEVSARVQYHNPIFDALGLCLFTSGIVGPYPELLSQLVNAQLGQDFKPEDLFNMARNTIQWEKEFNRRAGFTRQDDRLPEYFTETPNPAINTVFGVVDEELDRVHN